MLMLSALPGQCVGGSPRASDVGASASDASQVPSLWIASWTAVHRSRVALIDRSAGYS